MSKKKRRVVQRNEFQVIVNDIQAREDTKRDKTKFNEKDLTQVTPLTQTQKDFFTAYFSNYNMFLSGSAGTGKTFLSIYLALKDVLKTNTPYERLVILRSAEPSKSIGFLPGNLQEKMDVYEEPYRGICNELFDYNRSYDNLKRGGYIDFMITSYVRGITLNDCVVLVDESQNLTYHELSSVITRVGQNCKIVFSGDFRQSDLNKKRNEVSGLSDFQRVISRMPNEFALINFKPQDIVRSGMVKKFILAEEEVGV